MTSDKQNTKLFFFSLNSIMKKKNYPYSVVMGDGKCNAQIKKDAFQKIDKVLRQEHLIRNKGNKEELLYHMYPLQ